MASASGFLHNLTAKEEATLNEFQNLADEAITEAKHSDMYGVNMDVKGDQRDIILLKFLRAVSFDTSKAKERLLDTLTFRRDCKIDETVKMELPDMFKNHDYNDGVDRDGHPISCCVFSNMDLEKVFEDEECFVRYRLKIMEEAVHRMLPFKKGGIELLCSIHDYGGAPVIFQPPNLKKCIKSISKTLGDHYPEFKARSVFCNFPTVFAALWNAFSIFVPAATRARMVFLGAGDFTSLFDIVDPSQLPVPLGGFGPWKEGTLDLSKTPSQVFSISALSSECAYCPDEEIRGKKVAYQIRVLDGELAWKLQIVNDSGEVVAVLAEQSDTPLLQAEDMTQQGITAECEHAGKIRLHLNPNSYWSRRTVICRMVLPQRGGRSPPSAAEFRVVERGGADSGWPKGKGYSSLGAGAVGWRSRKALVYL